MVKELIELEFKTTGRRYYFSSYMGIFANFTQEELGFDLKRIYTKRPDANGVREYEGAFVRLLKMGGKKDIVREKSEVVFGCRAMTGGEQVVRGLNVIRKYCPDGFNLGSDCESFLIVDMSVDDVRNNGMKDDEVLQLESLGWTILEDDDKIKKFVY